MDPYQLLPEKLRGRLAVSKAEACKLLGCSPTAVKSLIGAGRLRAVPISGGRGERTHFLIPVTGIVEMLEGHNGK